MYINIASIGYWIELRRGSVLALPSAPVPARHVEAIPSSPGWHRQARRRRAIARKRIKASRNKGTRLPKREVALLESHHSAPKYRQRRLSMGKKANQPQSKPWASGRQWRGHGGGWSDAGYSGHYGGWGQESSYGHSWEADDYPSYAGVRASGSGSTHTPQENLAKEPSAGAVLVRGVQRLVTVARKAEVKTRKVSEERQAADQKWAKFQEDLKAKFIKARESYMKDVARLNEEMAVCADAQKKAFSELQEAMNNPQLIIAPPVRNDKEATDAWASLMGSIEDSDDDMAETTVACVQRSMQALMSDGGGTPPPRLRPLQPPSTPPKSNQAPKKASATPMLEAMLAGADPPGFGRDGAAPARTDPYIMSPTTRAGLPMTPERAGRSRSRVPRTPVKELGKKPTPLDVVGTPLSQKLVERREKAIEIEEDDENDLLAGLGHGAEAPGANQ